MLILYKNDEMTLIEPENLKDEDTDYLVELELFKLITGDIIISPILESGDDESKVVLLYPMSVILDIESGGGAIIPYGAPFITELLGNLEIDKNHIVHTLPLDDNYSDGYFGVLHKELERMESYQDIQDIQDNQDN